MKMKLQFIAFMLLMMPILMSCNKDKLNDSIPELRFSVNEREVYTDGIEYSFDILSGGGGYKAEICLDNEYDEYASATISGNKVNVKLVSNGVRIQVTDQYGQQKDLVIWTSNSSLQIVNHQIAVGYGFQHKGKFNFGSGTGYSMLKTINPGYAELIMKENGEYIANTLAVGNTAFIVRDSRGTTNSVKVGVWDGWDLESKNMTVNVKTGYQYTFIIKWGEGNVTVSDSSPELKNLWLLIKDKNEFQDNQVLQVCVNQGSVGEFFVELTDTAKNKVVITLNAQI